jgi:hypothetical protein
MSSSIPRSMSACLPPAAPRLSCLMASSRSRLPPSSSLSSSSSFS